MKKELKHIPFLGSGIGYRPELRSYIFLNRDKIDFVEIIAEHFMDVPAARMKELELLKAHFTVIPHAINLSLGSAQGVNKTYVKKLAALIHYLNPPYWSEHISYTQAHGSNAGHLSPIIYNPQFLEVMVKNISEVKQFIEPPLILENITYHVELPGRHYNDAAFLNLLCEQSSCGLLLDLANLFINSSNFGFDPYTFINELQLENIVQLHYVGYEQSGGQLTDTHAQKTQSAVFDLMRYLLERHVPKGILLERDTQFEAVEEISEDLLTVKQLLEKTKACS